MQRYTYWLLLVVSTPLSAFAQSASAPAAEVSPEWAQCNGGPGISDDAQIAGCTAIIQAGQETSGRLAVAYRLRCDVFNEKNEYDAALRDCDRAVALDSNDADAYRSRASVYFFGTQDYDRAIADLDQAIRLEPDSGRKFLFRGMAYARKGDYDRAIEDLGRALQLIPNLGMATSQLADAKEAKARLAGGQKLGDPKAWCQGKALPQEGFPQDMVISGCTALIESGKEKPSDLAEDYFNRAGAYHDERDYDHAIPDYEQATELNPKNAEAYFGLGSIYYLKGDYARAISNLDRAVELKTPREGLYLTYRGYAYHARGQFDLAVADYSRVIELHSDDANAFLHRSIAYNAIGNYDRALDDCHQAIRLSRTSEATEGHNSCGDAHFHKGEFASAIDNYNQALTLWGEYPQALYGRGVAKMRNGDLPGGQADIDAARKLQPDIEAEESKLGIKP
jgi:tetratricopeptide (TPR) repeat protein